MILRIPNTLKEEEIQEFQRIYMEQFGKEISNDEATREGMRIIRLVAIVIDNRI